MLPTSPPSLQSRFLAILVVLAMTGLSPAAALAQMGNRRDCITNRGPSSLELKTACLRRKFPVSLKTPKPLPKSFAN